MLLSIHVKNFALINDANITLGEGLNILTGETGAGKSILIDAVNVALGAKNVKSAIRSGEESALVELVFAEDNGERLDLLEEMDIYPEEGTIIVSKRIYNGRSICKINDETVTASKIRIATSLLIDIHGQHEHQSLLNKSKHLEILDEYCRESFGDIKDNLEKAYKEYSRLGDELDSFEIDEEERIREMDFLRYEINEIVNAGLKDGEEEELTNEFRRMSNGRSIIEALNEAVKLIGYDTYDGAGEHISKAVRFVKDASSLDEELNEISDQLESADDIISGICRDINTYMDSFVYDEKALLEIEKRLDIIHGLQAKYGATYEKITEGLSDRQDRLEMLEQFEERKAAIEDAYVEAESKVIGYASQISAIRKREAAVLTRLIKNTLKDLNFLDVRFDIDFSKKDGVGKNGYDEVEFLISTNPGEELKPLAQVASGGELSRIMLAIKTVLADSDDIETLIFDEIDTGISGRTAQKVAEKLGLIAAKHQVICITHLPQIAAMADTHFRILKTVENGKTVTKVEKLNDVQQTEELARLLGGAAITGAVMENAREMKKLVKEYKKQI
ncbi:MAG: DNA repair protein RecN [Lachnospiraceae bacterium]|nr:DNA repair protein RecN [Lachnospiraceae bacterium]